MHQTIFFFYLNPSKKNNFLNEMWQIISLNVPSRVGVLRNWKSSVYVNPEMSIYLSTLTRWPFYCIFPLPFFHFSNRKIEGPLKIKAKYPVNTRQWFKKSRCHCYCISILSSPVGNNYTGLKTFFPCPWNLQSIRFNSRRILCPNLGSQQQ